MTELQPIGARLQNRYGKDKKNNKKYFIWMFVGVSIAYIIFKCFGGWSVSTGYGSNDCMCWLIEGPAKKSVKFLDAEHSFALAA